MNGSLYGLISRLLLSQTHMKLLDNGSVHYHIWNKNFVEEVLL